MSARGPDITRSAAGRMMAESVWVPSVLCRPDVVWTALDRDRPRARVTVAGETADVTFAVEADGTLRSVSLLRWSNPDNTRFRYVEFGAVVEQQGTFGGFTIPTRLRVGYFIGTARFDSDGEFFRAEIATAAHR
jgi:hypothetical protein